MSEREPLSPREIAAGDESDEIPGEPTDQSPEGPQGPYEQIWDMCMSPAPNPEEAGRLFDPSYSWDMYVNAGVQGMSGSGGMPSIVMIAIGLFMLVAAPEDSGTSESNGEADGNLPEETRGIDEALGG